MRSGGRGRELRRFDPFVATWLRGYVASGSGKCFVDVILRRSNGTTDEGCGDKTLSGNELRGFLWPAATARTDDRVVLALFNNGEAGDGARECEMMNDE